MKRFLWLGLLLFLLVICLGCGDTFRPVIIPNPPAFPDPRASHTVMAVNDNGPGNQGSVMVVDVSGDSDVGVRDVGIAPVHAVQQTANQVLVVNHAAPGANADSLTKLIFLGTQISNTTTISLPPDSAPNFVAVAPSDTTAYVTLPNVVPDPINFPNDNAVGAVSTTGNTLVATIKVGNNPDAIAVTPDKNKLYVANKGDNSISNFNTIDRSPRNTPRITLSAAPLWLVARSDSQAVYALEANGTLAALETTSTSGPDGVTETAISVPGALSMLYDGHLNRLYIPGGSQLAVVDVSQSTPQPLSTVAITPVLPSARAQGDVCSTFSATGVTATAVAALPDGSRAYVGSYAAFEVDVKISNATLDADKVHTTYTYSLQPPGTVDLLPGMVITISGVISSAPPFDDFNGTFTILSVSGGTFQVANSPTDTYVSGGTGNAPNVCPQVTVINTSNNAKKGTDIVVPGTPGVATCGGTRFPFTMAAGGDSSRVYLASCDAGKVDIIDTATDTYLLNLPAPVSSRPPIPPSNQPPPQNPVFLIAGP